MDVKKVKPVIPEWHFKWSRRIQANCALTFSKPPNYFYTRLPILSWTTCIVSYCMSHFLPKEIRCIIITYCLLYFQLCVCIYVHIFTCGFEERRKKMEKEHIHTHTYRKHIHTHTHMQPCIKVDFPW